MPQEINIVQCFKCDLYQAQIAKKAKQWKCVVCGEKQSLKRVYFTGSGKDCRLQVQKLNELRLATKDEECEDGECEDGLTAKDEECEDLVDESLPKGKNIASKWAKYLDDSSSE